MNLRRRTATLVVLAALVAAGCDSGNDDGDASAANQPPSTATTASTTPDSPTTTPPAASGPAGPSSERPPSVKATLVAEFDQPLMLAPVPGRAGVFYVVEKEGRLRLLDNGRRGSVVLDIVEQVSSGGERGLLGLAVHPEGKHLYLNYTDREGDTRIVEYGIGANGSVDAATRRELLKVDQPYANHNGGHVAFGPDGKLYIALGDGGSGGDPQGNAQNLGTLLGKILRIEPLPGNDRPRYGVVEDNPFNGAEGRRAEIWAYGLRNPWRFSFDRQTGALWIGDVGQNRVEEINRAPDGSKGGENYGWNRLEGTRPFEGAAPADAVPPVYEYAREGGNCSVTGGHVYRGRAINGLQGWYVFGDFCRGDLWAIPADAAPGRRGDARPLDARVESFVSLADDGSGELFALSLQGGVYRLEAASS
ncbi:MAG TPA: PQQ-dependent sugar dehydrogenase [Acidimicrobiales bacterium]|nr:PQQ-dependent sugar dehydrogenase [Acidimicrobiales bacterium]